MRTIALTLTAVFGLVGPSAADDTARTLVEKAIEAQGGEAKVAKLRTMRIKAEGTMALVPGQAETAFTIEDVWQMPDRYRSTSHYTFMGMKVVQSQVIEGDKGWIEFNGQATDMPKEAVAEMREQRYAEDLDRLGFLKDADKELSAVPDADVNGKPAAGVRIKSKGRRDVTLYFDRTTGLLVKRAHAVLDPATGKEVVQEVVFADYADKNGVKHYKTLTAYRAGKKVIDAKVTEVEFLDKVDPKLFAKP
jgi:hypothetical protein